MSARQAAAVITIGTELTTGLRSDTNGGEVARALAEAGYDVREIRSLPDDRQRIASSLGALCAVCDLIVVTGGLGPTHDDVTREAAADALSRPLIRDPEIAARLEALKLPHTQRRSRETMLRQADVIEGGRVLPAALGTAPGQVIETGRCTLVLLPGPPAEMRPLLADFLAERGPAARPVRLRCTGITESDAQHLVEPAIAPYAVELTLLAAPGDVEVILFPREGDAADLADAATAVRAALGDVVYSADGSSLAETVLALARERGARIACAESCTGGMVAAALTDVAGSSDVFVGGVVSYANAVKNALLGVPEGMLAQHGAVSAEVAGAMALGALAIGEATLAVATSGVAGPGGGSAEKPVGLVWFAVAQRDGGVRTLERRFGGDRAMVRRRATLMALDLLRRELLGGA